jgi:hypothetical protein
MLHPNQELVSAAKCDFERLLPAFDKMPGAGTGEVIATQQAML